MWVYVVVLTVYLGIDPPPPPGLIRGVGQVHFLCGKVYGKSVGSHTWMVTALVANMQTPEEE